MSIEDLIGTEKVVPQFLTLVILRTPLSEYKVQSRGGVGNKTATTRDARFLRIHCFGIHHQYMMFFTEKENVSG